MNDRELLELAAKAAGYTVCFSAEMSMECSDGVYYTHDRGFPAKDREGSNWWNPLIDDGDAFRLALKLEIAITTVSGVVYASSLGSFSEPEMADKEAAARRSIVRAAAALASNGETV